MLKVILQTLDYAHFILTQLVVIKAFPSKALSLSWNINDFCTVDPKEHIYAFYIFLHIGEKVAGHLVGTKVKLS